MINEDGGRMPFGAWLLEQHKRDGFIGALAKRMRADRGFPRGGSVEEVRRYLSTIKAEGDAFAALDDAEVDWLCH